MTNTAAEQSWLRLRTSLGLKNKPQWPDPELSIGNWCRKLGLNDCWEAKGPAREVYGTLSREIKRILEERIEFLNDGESVPRTVTFSLYMTGRKTTSARPTILFCCERQAPRRRARNLIKESGILDKHPSWILGDCSFPPEFGGPLTRLALESMGQSANIPGDEDMKATFYRPGEKAYSIEIFLRGCDGATYLRRVTVGGIIRAEDRYYGLTVAHAFYEAPQPPKLRDDVGFQFDLEDPEEESDLDEESLLDETSSGSQTPESEESSDPPASGRISRISNAGKSAASFISNQFESNLQKELFYGKGNSPPTPTPSSRSKVGSNIDSDGFPWNQSAELSGPLVEFGGLAMSSHDSTPDSLDWALLQIKETQLQAFRGLDSHGPGPRFLAPERAMETNLKEATVIALTASGNKVSGVLCGTPTYLHVPQTRTFQEVWTVTLNGKLADGDCGTWVFDDRTGVLYGHIVSGNPESGVAYIMPAYQIFQDVKQRFAGADIELYMGVELSLIYTRETCRGKVNFVSQETPEQITELEVEDMRGEQRLMEENKRLLVDLFKSEQLVKDISTERDKAKQNLLKAMLTSYQKKEQNKRLEEELRKRNASIESLREEHARTEETLRITYAISREQMKQIQSLRDALQDAQLRLRDRDIRSRGESGRGNVIIKSTSDVLEDSCSVTVASPVTEAESPCELEIRPVSGNSVRNTDQVVMARQNHINELEWMDVKSDDNPHGARWTKISRRTVSPEALEAGNEKYEESGDTVTVFRILTRDEIQAYRVATQQIRAAREPQTVRELYKPTIPIPPQSELPYCVACLYIGETVIELKHKPRGLDFPGGRKLVILDQDGSLLLRHKIKLSSTQDCHPYTWHPNRGEGHDPLEVTFKSLPPHCHSVKLNGQRTSPGVPRYIFAREDDFREFQGELRGKELVSYFQCLQITSEGSSVEKECLRIWRDPYDKRHSISYHLPQLVEISAMEIPIAMLIPISHSPKGPIVMLEIRVAKPVTKSSSSLKGASIIQDLAKRIQARKPEGEVPSNEDLMRGMKYLRIQFSSNVEARKFMSIFKQLSSEEVDLGV